MSADELSEFLASVRSHVDGELGRILPEPRGEDPGRLREAMRYAVLGGGKRLRPAVAAGAALAVGGSLEAALPAAAAVELLHAYTLVHDDLPAMDDDDERRGRPTVHKVFGEAIAILVGDALLTEAFAALAALGVRSADAVRVLSTRAGAGWLLAGQARDLAAGDTPPGTLAELEAVHEGETGALFAAAAELGGIAAGADLEARRRLAGYGMQLGVAFQHADDLADADNATFAADARRRVHELITSARAAIAPFGARGAKLDALADWVARSVP